MMFNTTRMPQRADALLVRQAKQALENAFAVMVSDCFETVRAFETAF